MLVTNRLRMQQRTIRGITWPTALLRQINERIRSTHIDLAAIELWIYNQRFVTVTYPTVEIRCAPMALSVISTS